MGTLKWQANPVGRKPAKYRVYGSDEKGFTVMDKPRQLSLGVSARTEWRTWNPWAPPNFIAETTDTQLVVMGPTSSPPATRPITVWSPSTSGTSAAGLPTMPSRLGP